MWYCLILLPLLHKALSSHLNPNSQSTTPLPSQNYELKLTEKTNPTADATFDKCSLLKLVDILNVLDDTLKQELVSISHTRDKDDLNETVFSKKSNLFDLNGVKLLEEVGELKIKLTNLSEKIDLLLQNGSHCRCFASKHVNSAILDLQATELPTNEETYPIKKTLEPTSEISPTTTFIPWTLNSSQEDSTEKGDEERALTSPLVSNAWELLTKEHESFHDENSSTQLPASTEVEHNYSIEEADNDDDIIMINENHYATRRELNRFINLLYQHYRINTASSK